MFPKLVQFGMLTIPTQGACIALGLMLALLLAVRASRLLALDADRVWNLAFLAVFSFILGGRIVLFATHWHDYAAYPAMLLVVSIHSPALLIASATIAIAACILSLRMHPLPILRTLDALTPPLVLGYAFACIGAFASGADYGTPTTLPWAVHFHSRYALMWNNTPQDVPLHPVQLYQAAFEFALCGFLLFLLKKNHKDGEVAGAWLFLGGISHFVFEFYRGGRGTELFDTTQLAALLMIAAGGILYLDRKRDPAPVTQDNAL
jgi:phosphatidylglycerol:prolipoprotein diacylglycerol transferase